MKEKLKYADKRVVIVVPVYKELNGSDNISIIHLRHYLDEFDKCIISPRSFEFELDGFDRVTFDDRYFVSVESYSKLMLSEHFYKTFVDYEYILIYQLDCLVFSKDLIHWCNKEYDYIGAPWLTNISDESTAYFRVGNGGLSLRKVKSFLNVIETKDIHAGFLWHIKKIFLSPMPDIENLKWRERIFKRIQIINNIKMGVKKYIENYTLNEDRFWSDRARLFVSEFKIAPVNEAIQFSFERFPEYCFVKNEKKLPFGCHAWEKWNKQFWSEYLIKTD